MSEERGAGIDTRRRPRRGGKGFPLASVMTLCLLLAVAFGAGYGTARLDFRPSLDLGLLSRTASPTLAPTTPTPVPLDTLIEAWGVVRDKYVDRQSVQQRDLAYGAIGGLVAALNDTGHSRFLTPEDLKRETSDLSGKFEGIGASVAEQNGKTVILVPIDGSPAKKAGVLAGDVILMVNGESVEGLSLNEVVSKIRGPAGTTVRLTLLHPGAATPTEIDVVRAEIPVRSVSWALIPGTAFAHIRLSQFADNTSAQLIEALQAARAAGATGVVLDLRNNFGGYLHEGINVASQFLASGNVLIERDASDNRKVDEVKPGGVGVDLPMVVLINEGTASAAEIVAGSIQDNRRGRLIGQKSFGAGTVLSTYHLKDGSALLIGTSEWLTPNGRRIWKTGITPDIAVAIPTGQRILTPDDLAGLTPEQLSASGDAQLRRAVDELSVAPVPVGAGS